MNATQITSDDTLPAVHIVREFDAPASAVYAAHADGDLYGQWSGPHGLSSTVTEWDCRTGGAWSYAHADEDGNEYAFYGSFHEVRPNERIVQTFTYVGFPDEVSLERLTLEDLGGNRCRLTAMSLFSSFEARDGMVASGMEVGVSEGYEKLDTLLAAS